MPRRATAISSTSTSESLTKWIILFAIIAVVLALAAFAIYENSKKFAVKIPLPGGQAIEVTLEGSGINLLDILDCLLGRTPQSIKECEVTPSPHPELVKTALAAHGYYSLPSREAVERIRNLENANDTDDFAKSIRAVLYDLAGPFAKPWTFQGVTDDRLLQALEDLEPSNPLITELWRWNLDRNKIFNPEVKIIVKPGNGIAKGNAEACMNSILLGKNINLRDQSRSRSTAVSINNPRPCQGLSPKELLSGRSETVWLSKDDYSDLYNYSPDNSFDATSSSLEAIGLVYPKYFLPQE